MKQQIDTDDSAPLVKADKPRQRVTITLRHVTSRGIMLGSDDVCGFTQDSEANFLPLIVNNLKRLTPLPVCFTMFAKDDIDGLMLHQSVVIGWVGSPSDRVSLVAHVLY